MPLTRSSCERTARSRRRALATARKSRRRERRDFLVLWTGILTVPACASISAPLSWFAFIERPDRPPCELSAQHGFLLGL